MMALTINRLSKTYPNGVKALDDVTLEINKGITGLLGPNGAGKSTLMRTLATLQRPDSGSIDFEGINVLKNQLALRKVLGYLPQHFGVYPNISAENLLDYIAILKGIHQKKYRKKMIEEVLEITNLYEFRKKEVAGFSGGMKQRFGIAQLLLNKPRLIIVDEPTAGLDPLEKIRFLNIIRTLGASHTVIFSTHIVEDIQDMCQTVTVLYQGKVIVNDNPLHTIENLRGKIWTGLISPADFETTAADYAVLSSTYNKDHLLSIRVYHDEMPGPQFKPAEAQLDDVYFHAINKYR